MTETTTQVRAPEPVTYLLVDGENIDATLGLSVLGHRPTPEQRPRWERVRSYAAGWGAPVKALFFLNASRGELPASFVQALLAMDFRPLPLSGDITEKVVDIGVQRTLDAIAARRGNVMLLTHDADFVPQLSALLGDGRRVAVVGFPEFVSTRIKALTHDGLEIVDVEAEVGAFNVPLPRVRIIPIEDFDPAAYL
ncbi:MAG: NYN domain-containing protein [Nocardioidaceae bacterium]|nr:NYN domain-containing protein [Nocardioidaceae bacterium]